MNEAEQQVAFADKILLNKTDLVEEKDLIAVCREIRLINKYAKIIRTQIINNPPDMNEVLSKKFALKHIFGSLFLVNC